MKKVVLIIVIIAIVFVGYLFYKSGNYKNLAYYYYIFRNGMSPKCCGPEICKTSTTASETANWQTYTNTKDNKVQFTIKYPANHWTIKDPSVNDMFYSEYGFNITNFYTVANFYSNYDAVFSIQVDPPKKIPAGYTIPKISAEVFSGETVTQSPINIAGYNVTLYKKSYKSGICSYELQIYRNDVNKYVTITYGGANSQTTQSEYDEMQMMLSTFKFTK